MPSRTTTNEAGQPARTKTRKPKNPRKRKRRNDVDASDKPIPEQRVRYKKVNELFERNDKNLEPPTERDYNRRCGPLRGFYPDRMPTATIIEGPLTAPHPQIPDPYDDAVSYKMVPNGFCKSSRKRKRNNATTRRPRKAAAAPAEQEDSVPDLPASLDFDFDLDFNLEQDLSRGLEGPPKPSFCTLPTEVRYEIYRYLLIASEPVLVRGGWKHIYERDKPILSINILTVNRKIHDEAVRILYGENTFRYLLRDPVRTVREVADVDRLPRDDRRGNESDFEDDHGNDSDGESEYEESAPRRPSKKAAPRKDWDINLDEYGHLIRFLELEAESNRFSADTQQNMAEAIDVFTPRNNSSSKGGGGRARKGPRAAVIHTLIIRVAPMHTESSFTHINFFNVDSPVFKALKDSSCRYLKVELLNRSINWASPGRGCCIRVDMRYYRHYRYMEEQYAHGQRRLRSDLGIIRERKTRAEQTESFLEQLEERALAHCQRFASESDRYEIEEWDYDENGQLFLEYI